MAQTGVFCSLWTPILCYLSYALLFSFIIPHWDYLPGHSCRGTLLTSPKFLLKSHPCCWESTTAASLLALCAQLTPHHFLVLHQHLSHLLPLTSSFMQWQPFRCACMSRSAQQKHPGQESQVCDTAGINDILNVTGNSTCWNSVYTLTCGGAY